MWQNTFSWTDRTRKRWYFGILVAFCLIMWARTVSGFSEARACRKISHYDVISRQSEQGPTLKYSSNMPGHISPISWALSCEIMKLFIVEKVYFNVFGTFSEMISFRNNRVSKGGIAVYKNKILNHLIRIIERFLFASKILNGSLLGNAGTSATSTSSATESASASTASTTTAAASVTETLSSTTTA